MNLRQKICNKLFGWDYVVAPIGYGRKKIRRVVKTHNGATYKIPGTLYDSPTWNKIDLPEEVEWLTCSPFKYLNIIKKERMAELKIEFFNIFEQGFYEGFNYLDYKEVNREYLKEVFTKNWEDVLNGK
jgi:hypothetical protein